MHIRVLFSDRWILLCFAVLWWWQYPALKGEQRCSHQAQFQNSTLLTSPGESPLPCTMFHLWPKLSDIYECWMCCHWAMLFTNLTPGGWLPGLQLVLSWFCCLCWDSPGSVESSFTHLWWWPTFLSYSMPFRWERFTCTLYKWSYLVEENFCA